MSTAKRIMIHSLIPACGFLFLAAAKQFSLSYSVKSVIVWIASFLIVSIFFRGEE